MTVTTANDTTNAIVLQVSPIVCLNEDDFFALCQLNSHLRIERTCKGELIIMSPAGSETGNRNFKLIQQLANWTDRDGTGIGFDSSAGFILPNGATRSPDASWIKIFPAKMAAPKPLSMFITPIPRCRVCAALA